MPRVGDAISHCVTHRGCTCDVRLLASFITAPCAKRARRQSLTTATEGFGRTFSACELFLRWSLISLAAFAKGQLTNERTRKCHFHANTAERKFRWSWLASFLRWRGGSPLGEVIKGIEVTSLKWLRRRPPPGTMCISLPAPFSFALSCCTRLSPVLLPLMKLRKLHFPGARALGRSSSSLSLLRPRKEIWRWAGTVITELGGIWGEVLAYLTVVPGSTRWRLKSLLHSVEASFSFVLCEFTDDVWQTEL